MEPQENKPLHIAFISPSLQSYSETFIQAQKELLPHKIFHYYNGIFPTNLENGDSLKPSLSQRILAKFTGGDQNLLHRNVKKSFAKNKIDLVLTQFGPVGAAMVAICKELKLPLIVHFHGADAYVEKYINPIQPYKTLFNSASGIIVVSDDMKEQLLKLGAPEKKIYKTCYGPKEEFFGLHPARDQKRFLSIGRFVDKKAPYFTILAFEKVVKQHGDAVLTMVGDGPLLSVCKNLVKYLKIENNVVFKGSLSHSEVSELMERSLCFIQHSITADDGDKEGSPVAIIEAAAGGLPVVSTNHAGISFTVIHAETGYLVNECDVDGMAYFMSVICDDLPLARILGDAGRKHVKQTATMDKYISDINDVIMKAYKANKS